jgi:N6-L-threonylcarbamoyladenine synthase
VYYPALEFCTDNGAMIAFAGALRLARGLGASEAAGLAFSIRPRWDLETLTSVRHAARGKHRLPSVP